MKKNVFILLCIFNLALVAKSQLVPDGSFVTFSSGKQVYFTAGNSLFLVEKGSALKAPKRKIITLDDDQKEKFQITPNDTTLVQEVNKKEVYIILDQQKHLVPIRMLDLTYAGPYVNIVPERSLEKIPEGKKMQGLEDLTQEHFDTLQKFMAYNLAISFNTVSKNDFIIGEGINKRKLNDVDIDRIITVNELIRKQFNNDKLLGNTVYRPKLNGYGEPIGIPDDEPYQNQPPKSPPPPNWIIPNPGKSMRGFADMHTHVFANMAFGGKFNVGAPYGDIRTALASCSYSNTDYIALKSALLLAGTFKCAAKCLPSIALSPVYLVCLGFCMRIVDIETNAILNKLANEKPHGFAGSNDVIGHLMREHFKLAAKNIDGPVPIALSSAIGGIYHNENGYSTFEGWPRWDDFSHQRSHTDFLRRAYEGGMRLMVMLAVENTTLNGKLAIEGVNTTGYNEMNGIRAQIAEAKKMEQYIQQNQGGWLKIVYSAAEAEQAIKDGKLAMVLGTENSYFLDNPTNFSTIASNLQDLYNLGVRHVYTIHEDDNNFGGAAYFASRKQDDWVAGIGDIPNLDTASEFSTNPVIKGKKNAKGLTSQGVFLQQSLMSLGMIYEIDHMSEKTKNSTLTLAEQAKYPGLAASHCGFLDVNALHQLHEGQFTSTQLRRLNNLGGMVGLILSQGYFRGDVRTYGTKVIHSCGGTSETFAQAYLYAVDSFSAPGGRMRGIAFGCDLIPIPLPGPRFGSDACPGTGTTTNGRLVYPFTSLFDGRSMNKYSIGYRTYDYNVDGMAHIGMYPDFIADLQTIGLTPSDIEPIYHSAEEYINMWKKAETIRVDEYVKFLTTPSNQDLFFRDVANQTVFILRNGTKSINTSSIPAGTNVVVLPTAIARKIPAPRIISGANATLIGYSSTNRPIINVSVTDGNGDPIIADIYYNNRHIGNSASQLTLNNITCSYTQRTRIISRRYNADLRRYVNKTETCDNYTCGTVTLVIKVAGYPDKTASVNLNSSFCETSDIN